MSTERHEALNLAEVMGCFSATQRNSDNAAGRAATMLRQQHELIVQMAEALDDMSRIYTPTDGARNAHAAATQYLTRGPKT